MDRLHDNRHMKVALALFGIAYQKVYNGPHTNGPVSIDFRRSVDNYKDFIIRPFAADVFISTYASDKTGELLAAYAPKAFAIDNRINGRNKHLARALQLVSSYDKQYDAVFATRFDLLFQTPFAHVRIDPLAMNIVTRLNDGLICDNLYIFPYSKLARMHRFVQQTRKQAHYWEHDLTRIFGRIHFLTVDPTWIGGIRFYKIVRRRVADGK